VKNGIRKRAVSNPMTGKLDRRTSGLERAGNRLLLEAGRTARDGARVIGRREMTRGSIELIDALGIAITPESAYRGGRG
jgi:hypothetical protein